MKGSGSSTDAGPWHDRRMSATSTLRTQSRVSASQRWGLNQPVHHAIDDTRPIGLLAFRQGGRVKRLVRASGGSVNWCRSEPCSTSIGGSRVKRSPSRGQRTRDGGAAHRETNLLQPGVSRNRAQLSTGPKATLFYPPDAASRRATLRHTAHTGCTGRPTRGR